MISYFLPAPRLPYCAPDKVPADRKAHITPCCIAAIPVYPRLTRVRIDCGPWLCLGLINMIVIPQLNALFARPLRGQDAPWPNDGNETMNIGDTKRRFLFHGIADLPAAQNGLLVGLPKGLMIALHEESVGRAMWELSHRNLGTESYFTVRKIIDAARHISGKDIATPPRRSGAPAALIAYAACGRSLAGGRRIRTSILCWQRPGPSPIINTQPRELIRSPHCASLPVRRKFASR